MNDSALAEAMTLHQAGRFAEAARLYRAILARDHDHVDSLHLLGLVTAEQGNPEAGIALIRRAMAIRPGCAPHYNSLGHAYRRLGRLEDAASAYRAGSALQPSSAEIHSNLATTLLEMGRRDEAVAHYRRAAEQAPGVGGVWDNLAQSPSPLCPPAGSHRGHPKARALRPGFFGAPGQ